MRKYLKAILLISVALIISCKNEDGLSENLVTGVIDGNEWHYQYAKAFFDFNERYDVEMFGQLEIETEPCVINSINGYISVALPVVEGTYNLPFAQETESLKFHLPGAGQKFFVANSGFIEVITVSGRRVAGFLQANFDQSNAVEGTFIFDRCN